MSLNKAKGNMYKLLCPGLPPVVATWNPVAGCLHNCRYCHTKYGFRLNMQPRFRESFLKDDLYEYGIGTIFVGSVADMWGHWAPDEWISKVLRHCLGFPENFYLFQSKFPHRFLQVFSGHFNWYRDFLNLILATTVETNRDSVWYKSVVACGSVEDPGERVNSLRALDEDIHPKNKVFRMVTVEPILEMDPQALQNLIGYSHAEIIVVGANSYPKACPLPEPSAEDISTFVYLLSTIEHVRSIIIKENLKRLLGEKTENILTLPKVFASSYPGRREYNEKK